jgi:transcriptional regulator with XRE-family HTH domain
MEQGTFSKRLKKACVAHGFTEDEGDNADSRRALMAAAKISKMGMSKLFTGKTAEPTVTVLFAIADRLKVDPRWLGTGLGHMRQSQLPTDALEVAAKLNAIQDANLRQAALAVARTVANDPAGQLAKIIVSSVAEPTPQWSDEVKDIANQLERITDAEKRKFAIAKASLAAFRPAQEAPVAPEEAPPAPPRPRRRHPAKR